MTTAKPGTRIENMLRRATCRRCGPTIAMQLIREGQAPVRLCGFCREPMDMHGDGADIVRPAIREALAT